MNRILLLILTGFIIPFHPVIASPNRTTESESVAEGIKVTITLPPSPGPNPREAIRKAFQEGRKIYRELDAHSSGEVSRINENAGKGFLKVSEDLLRLFHVCMQIYEWSDGLFDVVKAKTGVKIKDPQLEVNFGERLVRLPDKRTYLDFYGILKGFVIDRMAGVLRGAGFQNFMIQTEVDIRTEGRNGMGYWRVSIPDPQGHGQMLCRVSLETASVATADIRDIQGARLRVGKLSDKLSDGGKTSDGVDDLQSVTIITKNATNATALSATGLLVGKAKAREIFSKISSEGFGAILEDRNGKIMTIGDVTAACFEG